MKGVIDITVYGRTIHIYLQYILNWGIFPVVHEPDPQILAIGTILGE